MKTNNQSTINNKLADVINPDVQNRYSFYKTKIQTLYLEFQELKQEGALIAGVFQKMQNQKLIDNHISVLMNLVKNYSQNPIAYSSSTQEDLKKIENYFNKVQKNCVEGLKTIFEIREFFTNQKFVIYLQQGGKVFEFSVKDIDTHANSIIPIYTNSLDKMIQNMTSTSKTIAPELRKLGLSLKSLDEDNELKEILPYQEYVSQYSLDKNIEIPENRKLEAAIYLYTRRQEGDFDGKSHSRLARLLNQYFKKGGLSDTVTMYKLGDSIQQINNTFVNIEVKMHDGTISLNMIANGIKKLYDVFSQKTLEGQKEKLIKMFTVNSNRLSSVIEKEAQKDVVKHINEIFKSMKN